MEHLTNVADLAAKFGTKFGAERLAWLAGMLHDLGKYSSAFQSYIAGRGVAPDHSTAGAQEVRRLARTERDNIAAQLAAYAIAGHHGGLPDGERGASSLAKRLEKQIEPLAPIWRAEIQLQTQDLLPAWVRPRPTKEQTGFALAFLGRMIFSCLVDADRLDTEAFRDKIEGRASDRDWPKLTARIDGLVAAFDAYMAGKLATLSEAALQSDMNRLRTAVLAHARAKASLPKGVFTLDVPTGGGKTLASLAFALDHAKCHRMDRIIYAIPFTSVIDQAAEIFRGVLGADMVLEHHSSIDSSDPEKEEDASADAQRLDMRLRLALENWAAPVVVTTNVQLFESLFSHKTTRCRRLHNLANAVIVLDEVQTIPLHVLRPCVAALDELARNYGCSILLCTATQPALKAPNFAGGFVIGPERELAPDPSALHAACRRVTPRFAGRMTDGALIGQLAAVEQGLVIVNSRAHALTLYRAGRDADLAGLIHLSTRQTAADRQVILAEIRRRLASGEPCRVVATSLVEAGLDLSLRRVWRALAGLDSVIQAAGRCNREGRWSAVDSIVTVFEPTEAMPPAEIRQAAEAMGRIASRYDDLFSPGAIEAFFREVYWQKGDGLDRTYLQTLDGEVGLAVLDQFRIGSGATDFAYRNVGENFRLIRDGMAPVIVGIDKEPKAVLSELEFGEISPGAAARRLQRFLVQVPPRARDELVRGGDAQYVENFGDQFAVLKTETLYSREEGLAWERVAHLGTDDSIA
ncbi:CRISPR-associated endonuclease Cas3'' [Phreatobacter sp. AB_2022a]|uniref:CRISPR-associated endonuclease Cas3'' n=1 Tax=Phreatobacter sp. AB_2022a TaxID=3003134 RepID=UPI002E1B427C